MGDRDSSQPRELRLEDFLRGRTLASGIFRDRFGKLRRQFWMEIDGRWDGKRLTLVESITYDDGAREDRTWRIKKIGENEYAGETDGMVGTAHGFVEGSTFHWRYKIALAFGARTLMADFDDWMFLQGDQILINCASVSKFGVRLGEVTCVFRKDVGTETNFLDTSDTAVHVQ